MVSPREQESGPSSSIQGLAGCQLDKNVQKAKKGGRKEGKEEERRNEWKPSHMRLGSNRSASPP